MKKFEDNQEVYAKILMNQHTTNRLFYNQNQILMFIDKSGDTLINEDNAQYCLGGIALQSEMYDDLKESWWKLKKDVFSLNSEQLFHANKHVERRFKSRKK